MKVRQPWKEYDHSVLEDKLNTFWDRTQVYKRLKAARKDGEKFYIVDGPPFTTSGVELGHLHNKILKDAVIRYKRLQGYNVRDQPGFDMHGLPIEVSVEASLGIKHKREVEELGVKAFVASCKDYAFDFQQKMSEQFQKFGIWMDWSNPYLTVDNTYIESAWWTLKKIHKQEFLIKATNILAWCPRCETALADSEIERGDTEGAIAYLKLPIKGRRDEYIVVYTAQFWTIIGNLAIAVHPNYDYARLTVRLKGRKETLIVLEEKVEELAEIIGIEAYEIIDTVKGKELEGLEYFHPLMADVPFLKEAEGEWIHRIVTSKSVRPQYTGCIHVAPGHGIDDFNIGTEFNLPVFSPLDERGVISTAAGMKYAGKTVEEAEELVLADLKSMRFVLHESTESHKTGQCWRCHTPVIYRATEQWCLRVNDIRDKLLKASKRIKWTPDWMGSERFSNWLKGSRDWCISRQRFWGIPMPVWECITDVCGHVMVMGSSKELEGSSGYSPEMDLHRPWIDNITLECPKCGGLMKRVPDTLDVWFDSSVASWAILNYPRKKKAFKTWWPADIIIEGHEQVKGWFFGQLVCGIMALGKIPYRSVLSHGLLHDLEGRRISKEVSEDMDPSTITGHYGIDALRLYLLKNSPPGENMVYNTEDILSANRTLRILWNSLAFATSYMLIDDYDPFAKSFNKVKKYLQPEDNWLLSRLESLTNDVKNQMDAHRFDNAAVLLEDFILNDLSRFYIRIIRRRMWEEGGSADKEAAYMTLHEALTRIAVLASPLIPYISEEIYQALDRRRLSVHVLTWPEVQAARLAEGSERNMDITRAVVDLALRLRQEHGLKLRWPVKKVIVTSSSEEVTEAVEMFTEVFKVLVNAKNIEVVPAGQEWEGEELEVIPNPNVIGKAYKQWESKVARMLRVLPAKEVKAKIEKGEYQLGIEGQTLKILPDMVNFKTKLPDGIVTEDFAEGQLFMDISQTDEIRSEGFAREIIRRIQDMRKDMELDIEEYVSLSIMMSSGLLNLLDNHGNLETIVEETRANQVEIVDDANGDYIIEWEIEGETIVIGITALDIKRSVDEYAQIPGIDRKLALALVDAGITGGAMFTDSQREFILKFPGMTNAKFRKIKEYFETPEELRTRTEEMLCPICEADIEPGAETCWRCGISADGEIGEIPEIEFIGELSEEEELAEALIDDEMLEDEEDEFEEEEERPAPAPRKAPRPQPEDELTPDELEAEAVEESVLEEAEVEPEDLLPEAQYEEAPEEPYEEEPEELEQEETPQEVGDEQFAEPEEVPGEQSEEETVEEEAYMIEEVGETEIIEEESLEDVTEPEEIKDEKPSETIKEEILTEETLVQRVLDTLEDVRRSKAEAIEIPKGRKEEVADETALPGKASPADEEATTKQYHDEEERRVREGPPEEHYTEGESPREKEPPSDEYGDEEDEDYDEGETFSFEDGPEPAIRAEPDVIEDPAERDTVEEGLEESETVEAPVEPDITIAEVIEEPGTIKVPIEKGTKAEEVGEPVTVEVPLGDVTEAVEKTESVQIPIEEISEAEGIEEPGFVQVPQEKITETEDKDEPDTVVISIEQGIPEAEVQVKPERVETPKEETGIEVSVEAEITETPEDASKVELIEGVEITETPEEHEVAEAETEAVVTEEPTESEITEAEGFGEQETEGLDEQVAEGTLEESDVEIAEAEEEPEVERPTSRKNDIIGGEQDEVINMMAERLNINPSMAKLLYNDGYHSIEDLEGVTEDDLREIKGIGKITARNIIMTLSSEETQMCTLCNAIVPVDAKACPRCGVRFAHEEDEEEKSEEKRQSTLELLDGKLKNKPDDVNLLYSKAMTLQEGRRYEEAIETLDAALEMAPADKKLLEARVAISKIVMELSGEIPTEELPEDERPLLVHLSESEDEDPIELKESFTYLIPEERSVRSYKLMKKMTNKGLAGFCITRTFPEKVRDRYELGEDTPILWLSNVSKDDAVRPKDLEKLSLSLEEFLNNQGGIVLLDGIEYLITNNNFITVLKLIQSLRDQVAINRSIMLLSVNPSTMDTHQINLLKREVDVVIDQGEE